jgi:pimeloyl-ACP methyl ester carboxylesterase
MGNPAVVIPGYLGSKLADAVHGNLVWLDVHGVLNPEITLEALRLDVGDPNRVVPVGILDEVTVLPPFWDPGVYNALTGFLRNNLKLQVFEFFYDWRKSVEEAADRLNDQVLRWLHQTGERQVDLVAHSFGGLVARAYLTKYSSAPRVGKLVTLGTPHKGAVEALQSVTQGYKLLTFPAGKVKQVTRTFPSVYEMMPNDAADSMFQAGGQNAGLMQRTDWCDTPAMTAAIASATARVARLFPAELPVETWMIAGTRVDTMTSASFNDDRMTLAETDRGDGTVPEVSASGQGLTGDRVFRFTVPLTPHVGLFGADAVQQRILTPILLGRPVPEVQLFSRFASQPLFVPRTINLFAAAVFRTDGTPIPNAEVRLSIAGTTIQNRLVPFTDHGDYALRVTMPGPGGGHPWTVTAQAPGLTQPLTDQGLLVPTER